jgi:hypothetical protein
MAINNFNVGVGTTSQLTRYLEQVFLNGVNLVRGQDYTATNGTSVGALTALVVSDVVEVFAYVPFNIANALTVSTVDAKGDLLVGTADNTIGKLTAGTDGQILSAASGETTGLKWINPGLVHIETKDFSAVSSFSFSNNVFSSTYENYLLVCNLTGAGNFDLLWKGRTNGTDNSAASYGYQRIQFSSTTVATSRTTGGTSSRVAGFNTTGPSGFSATIYGPNLAQRTNLRSTTVDATGTVSVEEYAAVFADTTVFDSISLITSTSTMTGKAILYGYRQ